MTELIQNGIEGNEYVSILSWALNTYKGEELLGHPDLKEFTTSVPDVLPVEAIEQLQDSYLAVSILILSLFYVLIVNIYCFV